MAEELVVGVDAGGTSTRALLVDRTGDVLGVGRSGGANPNAHTPEVAAGRIAEAIQAALEGADPGAVRACVVGMAGVSKLTDPAVAEVFESAYAPLELGTRVRMVTDAEAAFASATSEPDGTVLVAGTGSIAGRIRDRRLVSTSGGYGWLLGDEGSAFWIGREAVRATLAALGRDHPLTGLPAAVLRESLNLADEAALAALSTTDRLTVSRRLITACNFESPIRLARFAPLVSDAYEAGEDAAEDIVSRAAGLLAANAKAIREPDESTPVVLVGSVLGESSPVGARVRAALSGLDVLSSADGVLGAAWLAAVDAFGADTARPKNWSSTQSGSYE
ncbi:N-acetylglucosamine kinase [Amycolatopsis suaedae]|uniref:N-acetylglucosamine kinase n=1 Tax=Amycolatopsis suaedae TaxID=2510978 RepID=A0A4Q7J4L9_9PSEU|nr:BadF/BadG/BcrA/BcrD ATPase family protein [Amycolatopsis suaedae]RZQ61758.1 N-acetylglucosamine kinase [Amycolatopsis suaedae]